MESRKKSAKKQGKHDLASLAFDLIQVLRVRMPCMFAYSDSLFTMSL